MNSNSHCSSTVPDTIIQKHCLLSVEKVFTPSKSISPSGFSAIFRKDPRLPPSIYGSSFSILRTGPVLGKTTSVLIYLPFYYNPQYCNQMQSQYTVVTPLQVFTLVIFPFVNKWPQSASPPFICYNPWYCNQMAIPVYSCNTFVGLYICNLSFCKQMTSVSLSPFYL